MAKKLEEREVVSESNIETVDLAFFTFIDEKLNLHCTTNEGWTKVPVIWASAERAYQVKNNKEIRDKYGTLIPPIISIERTSISKDPDKKGNFQVNLAPNYNRYFVKKELNQDKTANFANADSQRKTGQVNFITSKRNKKQVYQYYSIPIPVYISVEYKISILTSYQQQMNEVIERFITKNGALNYFVIEAESHRFECFADKEYAQTNLADISEQERKYKTEIKFRVLGQIIGDGENQERPQIKKVENAVEIKIPRENIQLGTEQEERKKKSLIQGILPNAEISTSRVIKITFPIGDGSAAVYNITHNLNTRDMYVSIRENTGTYDLVNVGVSFIDENNISIDMGDPVETINGYLVTIIG
jgi:hypothetical protein